MFGDRLQELRKNCKMTQEELGNKLGVAKNTISCWESSISQPSIELIRRLADIFKVSTDYLLGINFDNLSEIDKIKKALKEAGMMANDDLTQEELEKALKIVEVMRNGKDDEK